MNRSLPRLTRARAARLFADESGAATAEYAIATMAAVAFAGLLVVINRALLTCPGRAPSNRQACTTDEGFGRRAGRCGGVTQPPRIPGKSSPAAGRSIHGMSSSHPHPPQR